ncbi:unnamed protein product [Vitrella brassicaformis CCMP3155]|uniref:Protein archease-like n=1 Tax=Vitrella brassicaformis (strain CCMP3155) TaxID=1169540 RepID=A0A0G4EFB0_VITBC|nr:unnamed protein product [Vitrella brassicaformis CCMP3155]|eukprot:CEL94430.1 unnamed protein product [Vitrella brassicaformis CCMP3155]
MDTSDPSSFSSAGEAAMPCEDASSSTDQLHQQHQQHQQQQEEDLINVEGMEIHSLPPRGRRQRHKPEDGVGAASSSADAGPDGDAAMKLGEGDKAEEEEGRKSSRRFEYLDHTADVILHAWGDRLKDALEQLAEAMFNYMTDIEKVLPDGTREIEAQGRDLPDLVFHFLDECLFLYGSEYFICSVVEILHIDVTTAPLTIRARGYGEKFDRVRHTQGTEIKAITMHEIKITESCCGADVYVLVDI